MSFSVPLSILNILFIIAFTGCFKSDKTKTVPIPVAEVESDNETVVGGAAGDKSGTREAYLFSSPPAELTESDVKNAIKVPAGTRVRFTGLKAYTKSVRKDWQARYTINFYQVEILFGEFENKVVWMDFYDLNKVPETLRKKKV